MVLERLSWRLICKNHASGSEAFKLRGVSATDRSRVRLTYNPSVCGTALTGSDLPNQRVLPQAIAVSTLLTSTSSLPFVKTLYNQVKARYTKLFQQFSATDRLTSKFKVSALHCTLKLMSSIRINCEQRISDNANGSKKCQAHAGRQAGRHARTHAHTHTQIHTKQTFD